MNNRLIEKARTYAIEIDRQLLENLEGVAREKQMLEQRLAEMRDEIGKARTELVAAESERVSAIIDRMPAVGMKIGKLKAKIALNEQQVIPEIERRLVLAQTAEEEAFRLVQKDFEEKKCQQSSIRHAELERVMTERTRNISMRIPSSSAPKTPGLSRVLVCEVCGAELGVLNDGATSPLRPSDVLSADTGYPMVFAEDFGFLGCKSCGKRAFGEMDKAQVTDGFRMI